MRRAIPLVVLTSVAACSFVARAPDGYRDDMQALLDTRHGALEQCYDDVLKSDAKAGGKVTVSFRVLKETGAVAEPAVDASRTTAPEPVRQCVLRSLDGLILDPADRREGQATFVWEFESARRR